MEDITPIVQGLTTIGNMVSTFRRLAGDAQKEGASNKFASELNTAIINMQNAVMEANDTALTAQAREAQLTQRISELEQEIMHRKDWDEEKKRYELVNLGMFGGMAYQVRKDTVREGEIQHYICTNCYEDHFKSILQQTGFRQKPYTCPRCSR